MFSSWFESPAFEHEVVGSAHDFRVVKTAETVAAMLDGADVHPDVVVVGHLELEPQGAVIVARRRWPDAIIIEMRVLRSREQVRLVARAGANAWIFERKQQPQTALWSWAIDAARQLCRRREIGQNLVPDRYSSVFGVDASAAPALETLRRTDLEVFFAVMRWGLRGQALADKVQLGRSTTRNSLKRVHDACDERTTRGCVEIAERFYLKPLDGWNPAVRSIEESFTLSMELASSWGPSASGLGRFLLDQEPGLIDRINPELLKRFQWLENGWLRTPPSLPRRPRRRHILVEAPQVDLTCPPLSEADWSRYRLF